MVIRDPFPDDDVAPIPRDKLAFIVLKARAYDAEVPAVDPDDSSNPSDDRAISVIESRPDSANARELRAAIVGLDDDAQAALVALVWIGRGDYDASEWEEALASARERRGDSPTARYLMGLPLLGDLVEEGAAALGVSITDEEQAGLHNPMTEQPAEEDRE